MSIKLFIKTHRRTIDKIIKQYYGIDIANDRERFDWINRDEGLYRWAHREGVNI